MLLENSCFPYGGANIYCHAFYGVVFDCLQNGKAVKEIRPPFQLTHAVYFYKYEDYGLSSPPGSNSNLTAENALPSRGNI